MDIDNILKPIQDALIGLIYDDDSVITDSLLRKTPLTNPVNASGMSLVLAQGYSLGKPFVYVRIDDAPDHAELL